MCLITITAFRNDFLFCIYLALGKIPYVTVEQKNSTALKVIWNLDCSAQKAVVDRYEITYCRIHKNKICKGK